MGAGGSTGAGSELPPAESATGTGEGAGRAERATAADDGGTAGDAVAGTFTVTSDMMTQRQELFHEEKER